MVWNMEITRNSGQEESDFVLLWMPDEDGHENYAYVARVTSRYDADGLKNLRIRSLKGDYVNVSPLMYCVRKDDDGFEFPVGGPREINLKNEKGLIEYLINNCVKI